MSAILGQSLTFVEIYHEIISTVILLLLLIQEGLLSVRAIPEKNTWGGGVGEDGRRYIFLWVVGAESFQIIWVIGVRPNLITWVVGVSLRGRGR